MQVRRATSRDRVAVSALLESAPFSNHLLAARLQRESGAELWGCWREGELSGAVAVGAALYPSRIDSESQAALADLLPERAAMVGSITGERESVLGLWNQLAPRWPVAARLVRQSQPFLVLSQQLTAPADSPVRRAREADLPAYTAAGAMMFAAEIEAPPPLRALQQRYHASIRAGRSFAAVSEERVYFKCDIGFVLDGVAHLQGVWLAPELRGRGSSAELLAGALAIVQAEIAPRVSLYVNDFNVPALALYRRLGFEQVDEYATVFF